MLQRSRPHSSRRQGFTLVELLVVILIISILSALLTVAVTKGLGVAKRTRNKVEIEQLAAAVDAFKVYYKVEYIPSYIYLSPKLSGYPTGIGGVYGDSLTYLQRLWPRLFGGDGSVAVNWSGTGSTNAFFLKGDQCLVFFLGGIPSTITDASGRQLPTCTGFSTNPADPSAHIANSTIQARAPFFEFESGRLVSLHNRAPAFYSYLDTYGLGDQGKLVSGLPYLYFSSYQTRNGYNRYYASNKQSECSWDTNGIDGSGLFPNGVNPPGDVFPYAQGVNAQGIGQYVNPAGFQIISAGADQQFGPGSAQLTPQFFWTPGTAANSGATGTTGADDQANFYSSLLGTQSVN